MPGMQAWCENASDTAVKMLVPFYYDFVDQMNAEVEGEGEDEDEEYSGKEYEEGDEEVGDVEGEALEEEDDGL